MQVVKLNGRDLAQVGVLWFVDGLGNTMKHVPKDVNLNCSEAVETLLIPNQEIIDDQVGNEISALTTSTRDGVFKGPEATTHCTNARDFRVPHKVTTDLAADASVSVGGGS